VQQQWDGDSNRQCNGNATAMMAMTMKGATAMVTETVAMDGTAVTQQRLPAVK
jgi:hypothetical protein